MTMIFGFPYFYLFLRRLVLDGSVGNCCHFFDDCELLFLLLLGHVWLCVYFCSSFHYPG